MRVTAKRSTGCQPERAPPRRPYGVRTASSTQASRRAPAVALMDDVDADEPPDEVGDTGCEHTDHELPGTADQWRTARSL